MIDKSFLSEFITPITDRTEYDIYKLRSLIEKGYELFTDEEKNLWSQDHKGALNASDMNRISNNSYTLGRCLGIDLNNGGSSITPFVSGQFLRTTDFQKISSDLQTIIDEIKKYTEKEIPTIPDLPFNDYIKINSIEKIQYIIYNIINEL